MAAWPDGWGGIVEEAQIATATLLGYAISRCGISRFGRVLKFDERHKESPLGHCGPMANILGPPATAANAYTKQIRRTETKKPWHTKVSKAFPSGIWWSGGGSNSRPSHCERDALPAELPPQIKQEQKYTGIRPGCATCAGTEFFQTNCRVAMTGAWSEGCSLRRGSLSMTQATQRLTSGADSSTWSMRRPALRRKANWR